MCAVAPEMGKHGACLILTEQQAGRDFVDGINTSRPVSRQLGSQTHDLDGQRCWSTGAFDVNLRHPETIAGGEARGLHCRLDRELGDHADRLSGGRRALRLRAVRSPGRSLASRPAARRGGTAAGRGAVRDPDRAAQAAAGRHASRHSTAAGAVTGDWRSPSQNRRLIEGRPSNSAQSSPVPLQLRAGRSRTCSGISSRTRG